MTAKAPVPSVSTSIAASGDGTSAGGSTQSVSGDQLARRAPSGSATSGPPAAHDAWGQPPAVTSRPMPTMTSQVSPDHVSPRRDVRTVRLRPAR